MRCRRILYRCAALSLAAGLIASGASTAKAKPWPSRYNAPPAKCNEGSFADGFAYHSKSYVILSHERISTGRVNEMATVAESVRGVLQRFPLQLIPASASSGGKSRNRNVVRLFSTHLDYLKAGGPKGSSGFFNVRSGEVIVSLEYLIEPKGQRSNLEPRQRYRLLVHELVHQAMAEHAVLLPLWLTEGIAEYLSAAQFAPGRYRFGEASARDIIGHMHTVWLHDRRNVITIPTIESLSQLDSRAWATDNRINPDDAYAKYAGSLLLTHYQLELASRNRGELSEFLAETSEKLKRAREQIGRSRRPRRLKIDQTPLWKDRPPALVQKQLAAYWKTKGLKLRFEPLRPLRRSEEHRRESR